MKRKFIAAFVVLSSAYVLSYIGLRQTRAEVREKDRKIYVIYPEDRALYYIFRPLSYIDGKLTGIGSHIGPHR